MMNIKEHTTIGEVATTEGVVGSTGVDHDQQLRIAGRGNSYTRKSKDVNHSGKKMKPDLIQNSKDLEGQNTEDANKKTRKVRDPKDAGKDEVTPVQRRVKNADFTDMEETGKWGSITKKEMYIVGAVIALILVACLVFVVVFVTRSQASPTTNNDAGMDTDDSNATASDAVQLEEFKSPDAKYAFLLNLLGLNPQTEGALKELPVSFGDLNGPDSSNTKNKTKNPILLAAQWVINKDTNNVVDYLNDRFALASIYYTNNGDNWVDNSGWLSSEPVCSWGQGVSCSSTTTTGLLTDDVVATVEELDFSGNNLAGTVPSTIALLSTLKVLSLKENALSGTIPGDVFGSMPNLIILYLQDNNFEGEIPTSLLASGSLGTLYVYGNDLNGTWPKEFCPISDDTKGPLTEFGLNCKQTPCPEGCCTDDDNCFA